MTTRTGEFPIGFRRSRSAWQQADLAALAAWAKEVGFAAMDLGWATPADVHAVRAAGLEVGSVDLLEWHNILSTSPDIRSELLRRNLDYIRQMSALGVRIFLAVVIPGDPARKRAENYALAVEGFAPLAQAIAAAGGTLALEGWPGAAPHYANLGCSPQSCRALIGDLGPAVSINYDPSHLIRLGIDPIRFLEEFLPHVRHVHAKDTRLMPEAAYELGLYQGSISAPPHAYGEHVWRYAIPGSGQMNWTKAFSVLARAKYGGLVSVELEDEDFCGSETGERRGLLAALDYLRQA